MGSCFKFGLGRKKREYNFNHPYTSEDGGTYRHSNPKLAGWDSDEKIAPREHGPATKVSPTNEDVIFKASTGEHHHDEADRGSLHGSEKVKEETAREDVKENGDAHSQHSDTEADHDNKVNMSHHDEHDDHDETQNNNEHKEQHDEEDTHDASAAEPTVQTESMVINNMSLSTINPSHDETAIEEHHHHSDHEEEGTVTTIVKEDTTIITIRSDEKDHTDIQSSHEIAPAGDDVTQGKDDVTHHRESADDTAGMPVNSHNSVDIANTGYEYYSHNEPPHSDYDHVVMY